MRYKAIVSYDGSAYSGWQKQANANSIQEIIETALGRIHQYPTIITASGRTDAHVHAVGQVFHFDSHRELASDKWRMGINSLLPRDIRIQSVEKVSDDFHARFDCISKRYDYLVTQDVHNPFFERYMGKERKQLDVEMMRKCSSIFLGTHDFTSFTSNKIHPDKDRVKTIYRLDMIEEAQALRMIFEGDGFLRYMVRMIAQTLIEAGKHRLSYEEIKQMLESKDKHVCRYKAEANGLYLMKVTYGGD